MANEKSRQITMQHTINYTEEKGYEMELSLTSVREVRDYLDFLEKNSYASIEVKLNSEPQIKEFIAYILDKPINSKEASTAKPWSTADVSTLTLLIGDETPLDKIAFSLGRTVGSVRAKASSELTMSYRNNKWVPSKGDVNE
jgi:hypothetical protein